MVDPDQALPDGRVSRLVLRLFTVRTDGQFNTTIHNNDDRLRGVFGNRKVLLMHPQDIERLGMAEGDLVLVQGVSDDGVRRQVDGLKLVPYDVPAGCVARYYPECNPLIPLWHHAKGSMVPAAKSIAIMPEKMATPQLQPA